jgi:hypothetical protein
MRDAQNGPESETLKRQSQSNLSGEPPVSLFRNPRHYPATSLHSRMVDFLILTANSNVSRLDIFDFSDFFDFQADVPPKINDLRNPGFGLWFALSSSKGKHTGSRAWAHWRSQASCWVNFETRLANDPLLPPVMPLRTRNYDGGPKKK